MPPIQHYQATPYLWAGEYPGSKDQDTALTKLEFLVNKGVRHFIDLTHPLDNLERYNNLFPEIHARTGIMPDYVRIPCKDRSVFRSQQGMLNALTSIQVHQKMNMPVYVHCIGGIGRTGTVIGCWFVELNNTPEWSLARVQELYKYNMPKAEIHPRSPETGEQVEYVKNWKPLLIL